MNAAPTAIPLAVPAEWTVWVVLAFHEDTAADLGRMVVEDALRGHDSLLRLTATRVGTRRVRLAFAVVADSAAAAAVEARAVLVARLRDVRPIPLWMPTSLTAQPASQG